MKTSKYYGIEEIMKLEKKYYEVKKIKIDEGDSLKQTFFLSYTVKKKTCKKHWFEWKMMK